MARILIIEDDDPLRETLRGLLEAEGHQVRTTGDGDEGLRLYAQEPAELVVVDILLPVRDGLEVILELRQRSPGVRLVAISGGGRIQADSYLATALATGADRALSKPFSFQELLELIQELLDGGR